MSTFVDTNYFLRFFLNDVLIQSKEARDLFESGAKGEVDLISSVVVFFEIYWVLTSYYQKSRNKILEILYQTLQMEFITLENKEVLRSALDFFKKTSLDLEDCYNLAYFSSCGAQKFATFDLKLGRQIKS